MRFSIAARVLAFACIAIPVVAAGGGRAYPATAPAHSIARSHGSGSPHSSTLQSVAGSRGKAPPGVHRDSHGKIARDPRQTNAFKKQHPCPSTGRSSGSCPGYTIDHITPLKRGGADTPGNMQWQTNEDAKRKDKWE